MTNAMATLAASVGLTKTLLMLIIYLLLLNIAIVCGVLYMCWVLVSTFKTRKHKDIRKEVFNEYDDYL